MKKIISLILMVFVLAMSSTAMAKSKKVEEAAAPQIPFSQRIQAIYDAQKAKSVRKLDPAKMPIVAVMYINNAKTTYDGEIDELLVGMLSKNIDAETFHYVNGDPFVAKLAQMGLVDLTTAERSDVVKAFEGENVDYVVFLQVDEFTRKDKMTFFTVGKEMTANVPFKMIDVKNNQYLYNGKFCEKAKKSKVVGGVGNKTTALKAIQMVADKVADVITLRLPRSK